MRLHPSHETNLKHLEACLDKSILDGETITIGGGNFLPSEQVSLLLAVRRALGEIGRKDDATKYADLSDQRRPATAPG